MLIRNGNIKVDHSRRRVEFEGPHHRKMLRLNTTESNTEEEIENGNI